MKNSLLLVLLLSISVYTFAQETPITTKTDSVASQPAKKPWVVNGSLQYISNLTYAGVKDVSSVPILLPTITLVSKTGFFLSSSGYFNVSENGSQAEGLSITPGYVFWFDKTKEYGGVLSATKYFITSASPIILSTFSETFDAQLFANPGKILKLAVSGSYRLDKGNSHDVINEADLSKEMVLLPITDKRNHGLKINPTLSLFAGTQSFNQTYFENSVVPTEVDRSVTTPGQTTTTPGGSNGILGVIFPTTTTTPPTTTIEKTIVDQTVTDEKEQEVRKYQVLAASISMPITYTIYRKLQLVATPYFIKPFNQVTYANLPPRNGMYFLYTVGANINF